MTVDVDVEMEFAHAGNDGLAGFLVGLTRGRTDPRRRAVARARPSFSWSALVFGSMAIWMTGSGNSMRSRMTGCSGSHSVSPVSGP
jgi:hypothetical protein